MEAWSDRDQFARWWGPKGCSIEVSLLDFRAGGFFHYAMRSPNASAMWGRFNYREIVPQERIVWLNSFANEKCGIARAPFSELCPLEIETRGGGWDNHNDVARATVWRQRGRSQLPCSTMLLRQP